MRRKDATRGIVWRRGVHSDLDPALRQRPRERQDPDLRGADLRWEVVGEEDDAHGAALKQTPDAERARVASVYARYADDPRKRRAWDAGRAGNREIRAELLAALRPWIPPAGTILDAGCGSGWVLAALVARDVDPARLHGVDLLADRARRAAAAVPGATVAAADLRELPVEDASFALAVCFTTLSSLASAADVRRALAELRRVLIPGGRLVVWEPRLRTPRNPATRLVTRRELEAVFGPAIASRPITVLPPLARALGPAGAYPALRRIPPLLTHRFTVLERDSG
jgi:SAM-dependent methyltransferase